MNSDELLSVFYKRRRDLVPWNFDTRRLTKPRRCAISVTSSIFLWRVNTYDNPGDGVKPPRVFVSFPAIPNRSDPCPIGALTCRSHPAFPMHSSPRSSLQYNAHPGRSAPISSSLSYPNASAQSDTQPIQQRLSNRCGSTPRDSLPVLSSLATPSRYGHRHSTHCHSCSSHSVLFDSTPNEASPILPVRSIQKLASQCETAPVLPLASVAIPALPDKSFPALPVLSA